MKNKKYTEVKSESAWITFILLQFILFARNYSITHFKIFVLR